MAELWYRTTFQQARVATTRRYLQDALLDTQFRQAERHARKRRSLAILQAALIPGRKRFTKERTYQHLGPIATGLRPNHPMLQILSETIQLFRDQGSVVLVCVMPINVEHAVEVGASDAATIRESIDVIRDVVTSAGGEFVDLHAIFPDEAFRDAPGHLRDGGEIDAARRVAEVIEIILRAQLAAQGKP
jgi:hypothetical protein